MCTLAGLWNSRQYEKIGDDYLNETRGTTNKQENKGNSRKRQTFDINDCYKSACFGIRYAIANATGQTIGDTNFDHTAGKAIQTALPAEKIKEDYPEFAPLLYAAAGLWLLLRNIDQE
jgi:hypothetical protein